MKMQKKYRKSLPLYFRRWTRKKYGAFATIHQVVKVCQLSLSLSLLVLPGKLAAQKVNEDSVMNSRTLSPVEIVDVEELEGNLSPIKLNATISQREIQRLPVQSLSDILENLPGLDIRQRGPLNTQADISYRGGSFEQTVVLLNGINFSDPQTGHFFLNLPFGPDAIQKIDLFSNTTSYLFGTSPFSGLINIITAPRQENSILLHAMGGMFGLRTFSVKANVASKRYRQMVTVGSEKSDGYIRNTDFSHMYGFYHGIGDFEAGKLEIQAGYTDRSYGANSFYTLKFPDQHDHTKTFISSIRWENKGDLKIIPSAYYRYNSDCFQLFRNTNKFRNDHITQVLGGNVRSFFDTRLGRTSVSVDVRFEDILSNILGESLPNPLPVKGEKDLFYAKAKTRAMGGVSLSQSYHYKRFAVNGTMLLQQNFDARNAKTGLAGELFPLPAVDLSYSFPQKTLTERGYLNVKTTFSLASALRAPTFLELYYDSPNILGNINLKPEKAKTIELANTYAYINSENGRKVTEGNINLFVRFGEHLIDFIQDPKLAASKWIAQNHDKITFVGLNMGTAIYPQTLYDEEFFLSHLSLQYDYLYSDRKPTAFLSRYVLDHVAHKFTGRLTHKIYRDLEVAWTVSYNKRKGNYTDVENNLQPYRGFWLLEGRISYPYKQFRFYVEATNIFNVKYFDYGDLVQPGVWLRAGLSYKFFWE